MSYSSFINDANLRKLIQEYTLQGIFRRPLIQKCIFRAVATPIPFNGKAGDSLVVTRRGLSSTFSIDSVEPGAPGPGYDDSYEQWMVIPKPFKRTNPFHIPSNAMAMGNKLMEEFEKMGENAGITLSRRTRAIVYNAVLGGRTVTTAAVSASTTVPVKHLAGFTRARQDDGTGVRYDTVSAQNPLAIWIYDTGSAAFVERNVVGYTATEFPTGEWKEVGAGTLTLSAAVTISAANYEVVAKNAQHVSRSGIGVDLYFPDFPMGVHSIGAGDRLKVADIRACVARLRELSVPTFEDGFYRLLLNSHGMSHLREDPEGAALFKEYPLQMAYMTGKIETLEGCVILETEEQPSAINSTADERKKLNVEIVNASSVRIHHALIFGKDFVEEHYIPHSALSAEGNGVPSIHKTGEFSLAPSGHLFINVDRVTAIVAPPIDAVAEFFHLSWVHTMDIVCASDGVDANSGGDPAKYKRAICLQYAT